MLKKIISLGIIIIVSLWYDFPITGMENIQVPLAKVVVSEVRSGVVIPEAEFVGTVCYPQVSDVASEVSGKVDSVNFEEGDRVKNGCVLIKINSDLLRKDIQMKKALYEQVSTDLELTRRDLKRIEKLYREEAVAEQVYDEHRFRVASLEKKSASMRAEIGRLGLELRKKSVRAPFDGVITKKLIEVGEWVSNGTKVATIARDDVVDVLFHVPENVLTSVTQGKVVVVKAGGTELTGKVFSIIPQGDIPTRTFPVKIRVRNSASLVAGMEAKAMFPRGAGINALIVERDAVISAFGENIVFVCVDSRAKMIPVKVTGYSGIMAGVEAPELVEGMKVVIKGNERLQDGQALEILSVNTGSRIDQ
ncbi:MAG: efflux RND transporter periplasmic adaptor subunit [Candidatus Brocadia sp.]|jgi:RND family efflux transporter MFP subunit